MFLKDAAFLASVVRWAGLLFFAVIGAEREHEKWQGVVEEQAALIAQLQAQIDKSK